MAIEFKNFKKPSFRRYLFIFLVGGVVLVLLLVGKWMIFQYKMLKIKEPSLNLPIFQINFNRLGEPFLENLELPPTLSLPKSQFSTLSSD